METIHQTPETELLHEQASSSTELTPNTDYLITGPNIDEADGFGVSAVIMADSSEQALNGEDNDFDEFLVIDLRNAHKEGVYKFFMGTLIDANVDYLLVNSRLNPNEGVGLKGLRKNEEFTVGRKNPKVEERFGPMNQSTSREHFSVSVDAEGRLHIADLGSSNGTRVLSMDRPVMNGFYDKERFGSKSYKQNNRQNEYAYSAPNNEPGSAESFTTETNSQEWERKAQEAKITGIDSEDLELVTKIERDFKEEVPFDIAIGIIRTLNEAKKAGLPVKQAKKDLYKKWHPDLHREAPEEKQKLAESVSKLIEQI